MCNGEVFEWKSYCDALGKGKHLSWDHKGALEDGAGRLSVDHIEQGTVNFKAHCHCPYIKDLSDLEPKEIKK